MTAEAVVHELLEGITSLDFPRITATMTPGTRMRALLPGDVIEVQGAKDVAARLHQWFGGADPFEVRSSSVEQIVDRFALRYRLRMVRAGSATETEIEQHLICSVTEGTIGSIDLVCSGFRETGSRNKHAFDAGELGCSDGLAVQFRERMRAIDIGDLLAVRTTDPSAKEDLPSLARLMGHTVRSVEGEPDGTLTITVERGK